MEEVPKTPPRRPQDAPGWLQDATVVLKILPRWLRFQIDGGIVFESILIDFKGLLCRLGEVLEASWAILEVFRERFWRSYRRREGTSWTPR